MQVHLYEEMAGRSFNATNDQIRGFMDSNNGLMDALWSELAKAKPPRRSRNSAERTRSSRFRSGSRKHPSYRYGSSDDQTMFRAIDGVAIGQFIPATHAARFQDIRSMFPLAPGQSTNLVKRWP